MDNSILYTRNDKYLNTTAGKANRTFGFLMRDMGTITGVGMGFRQWDGTPDTSVSDSSFYKTNLELTHLKRPNAFKTLIGLSSILV